MGETTDFKKYLLYGYDMLRNPSGKTDDIKRVPILDLDKLETYKKSLGWASVVTGNRKFAHKTYVGENEFEIASSIGAEVSAGGKAKEFGFSVDLQAAYSVAYTQGTVFGNVISKCEVSQYSNTLTVDQIDEFLSDEFVKDMKFKSAKDIFSTYGTHLIVKFSIGGKLSIKFRTKETTAKTSAEIKSEAEASYYLLTGGESKEFSLSAQNFCRDCNYEVNGIGGELTVLPKEIEGKVDCLSWFSTVEEKPALYEIEESIPIWELAPTASIENKLKKAYMEYNNEYLEEIDMDLPFITDLRVEIRSDSGVDSQKQLEEKVVKFDRNQGCTNADLNKGAKGKYIYLLYKLGSGTDKKVTDIIINYLNEWTGEPAKEGYTHIPDDLNKGAGGSYIFIDYKVENDSDQSGYQALGVRNTTTPVSKDWVLITDKNGNPVDLNKGAGGEYLYLFGYIDPLYKEIQKQRKSNLLALEDNE